MLDFTMRPRIVCTLQPLLAFSGLSALLALSALPGAAASTSPTLERQFNQTVKPFVNQYCAPCHSGAMPAAQLDLKSYATMDAVVQDHPRWQLVLERLSANEMPPKQMPQPADGARQQVVDWIRAMRADEAKRHSGDPGQVLARRLSNAEYNYTIRDLTGQDLKPTREFPVDPANQEGFDNSGESLTMSAALMKKYLEAAREVGDHLVLTPDGFDFSPNPMLVETDREKYAIQRIVNFYFSQPTYYADYFEAAWRYKNRAKLGKPNATLAGLAADAKLSPKYLPTIWQLLQEPNAAGPVAKLQKMFAALPEPSDGKLGDGQPEALRAQCVAMRDFTVRIRRDTAMQFAAPVVKGLPGASQPLLNWKLKQYAAHRRDSDPKALRSDTDPPMVAPTIPRYPGLHQEAAPRWAALTDKSRAEDPDLVVPAAERSRYEAAFSRFASVFPDVFYVTERGRYFPDDSEDKGRLLSAGYHSVVGYYRDDTPLTELILDEKGKKEIDRLWAEFDYIANFTERTWVQFFFNESGEVDGKGAESASERPADHAVTDEAVIMQMKEKYLKRAFQNETNDPAAPEAIRDHFDHIDATLRGLERTRTEAEPKQLDALLRFAARAWRRPLTKAERDDTIAYYHTLREKNELSHEEAIRDSVVGVLMAPDFLYRIDLAPAGTAPAARPLSSYALASRLSYFLWSSMPDQELMTHAVAGDLQRPEVLMAQARRLLKDERSRGLATEFGGNWLDFRQFETHNAVDRDRFPEFTNDLREAMFQEPIRFIENLFRTNGSALDMLYGNYTFVNPTLAKFYGVPDIRSKDGKGRDDDWVRVDDAGQYHRGGLLPMSVFMTQNSPGLRTSPVKRGYWVVHRVLGERIPPPPPVVPELPHDESKTDLPLREVLAQHRQNPVCAGCHAKFDVFGLAFEGYGPVGEARTKDLAGRPVDTTAMLPGGVEGKGVEGVQSYIRDRRQAQFVDNLSRKLLAYSLDRSLMLSDEPLIEKMDARLAANGYKIDTLVEAIVTSPQFLTRRGPEPKQQSEAAPPLKEVAKKKAGE
jgi:hypothetical protein